MSFIQPAYNLSNNRFSSSSHLTYDRLWKNICHCLSFCFSPTVYLLQSVRSLYLSAWISHDERKHLHKANQHHVPLVSYSCCPNVPPYPWCASLSPPCRCSLKTWPWVQVKSLHLLLTSAWLSAVCELDWAAVLGAGRDWLNKHSAFKLSTPGNSYYLCFDYGIM